MLHTPSSLMLLVGFASLAARSITGFAPPLLVLPRQQHITTTSSRGAALSVALVPGDSLLVVGGTGGIGQLVTQKTRGDFKVRITSRNVEQAQEILQATSSTEQQQQQKQQQPSSTIEVVPLDLVQCTPEELETALQGIAGVFISVGTTAFPTMKWRGGNTPQAIDADAVTKLVKAAAAVPTMKKIVLITSVGVYRTDEMPFKILNLFGVLDAKRTGEDALKKAATAYGVDYVILRPGRLIGGPFTNLDVARLMQIEGGAENGVDVESGDALLGDCKRDACAEAVVQALRQEGAKNLEFSIVSNEKAALKDEDWAQVFSKMAI